MDRFMRNVIVFFCTALVFFSSPCLCADFAPAPLLDVGYVVAARHFAVQSYVHARFGAQGQVIPEGVFEGQRWPAHPFYRAEPRAEEAPVGYVYRQSNKIIIAYHGSDRICDWICDFKITRRAGGEIGLAGLVHTGFGTLIEQTHDNLLLAIARIRLEALEELGEGAVYEYVTTGHSLGGALSILSAARLALVENVLGTGRVLKNQIRCIAFSAPNVGDEDCVRHIHHVLGQHNILCYANKFDVVTHVPPTMFGFYASAGSRVEYELFEHFLETSSEMLSGIVDLRPGELGTVFGTIAAFLKLGKKTLAAGAGVSLFLMHKATAIEHVKNKHLECRSIAKRLERIEDFPRYAPKHLSTEIADWFRDLF
jgi:hypothetical protein